ncbi:isoprenylcysteine carboxylmethyltransferase family protein [Sulfitobacter albidus]|uniref:Isoprenylcysteine carboxylmethyltransferase family protein n=1 Tax=Sulfitobacter albidus TaxID=2829501 RepID=A0A975JGB4_9RHOB|nr:isoprenylcysteine carboxylmethyltransferase family protein [Sulfitobacter albidus]
MGVFRTRWTGRRFWLAAAYGVLCHTLFALAVGAMIVMMFFGLSESFGRVPQPWAWLANLALVLQFPLAHSFLLNGRGRRYLAWFAPEAHAKTLGTTVFAIIASVQLALLFLLWTPSGIIWWQAEGAVFWIVCAAYGASWLLLSWASVDAGAEVQSGALGWMSLAQGKRPVYPGMPTAGLFRVIRQPIYVSFALTLWTVPIWTPDQLLLAVVLTAYCLIAPRLKERRFAKRYGREFADYRARTPYILPGK